MTTVELTEVHYLNTAANLGNAGSGWFAYCDLLYPWDPASDANFNEQVLAVDGPPAGVTCVGCLNAMTLDPGSANNIICADGSIIRWSNVEECWLAYPANGRLQRWQRMDDAIHYCLGDPIPAEEIHP